MASTNTAVREAAGRTSGGTVVQIENVSHSFRRPDGGMMYVLRDVSIHVNANEFFTVVGPSGCGKSTLLNIAAGLLDPTEGEIRQLRSDGTAGDAAVGYITQDSNLLPWLTVLENIMVPLEIRRVPKDERIQRAAEWTRIVGLAGFENHYPRQLSGGMQKRCSIARTMVYDPEVVFMDEPFGALDAITKTTLQKTLLELWQSRQKTIIFITHDLSEAIALSDRVAVMTGCPGTVKATLPVELGRPRDIYHITGAPGYEPLYNELWSLLEADLGI